MRNKSKGTDKFVPNIVYFSGVKNVFDIEKKCRIRIKENNPIAAIKKGNKSTK